MTWLKKTASAAALSCLFLGSAYAQPNPGLGPVTRFAGLTYTVHQTTFGGGSTTFSVDQEGNYKIITDGGMAHFEMIRGEGKLTQDELASLEGVAVKMNAAKPPADLPGLVPGSPEFTIAWNLSVVSGKVSGPSNVKGAIADAKSRGLDVSAWRAVSPIVTKLQKLETALEKAYNPIAPVPDQKPSFDELSIEEKNSWTGGTDKLTIKPDGTFTLERTVLGKTLTTTGTLTKAQLDAIAKAYTRNTLAADNGKFVGSKIPDDSLFTITAKDGGKTYTVNGSVDSTSLGPLQALEKALAGDVNKAQPPVAKPLVDDKGPSRTDGMNGLLRDRIVDGAAKADGKAAAADGR